MNSQRDIKISMEKTLSSQRKTIGNLVYVNDILYQIGGTYLKPSRLKRKWYFNPYLALCLCSIFTVRHASLILVKNTTYSELVGDFTLSWNLSKQINLLFAIAFLYLLTMNLSHYWYWRIYNKAYLTDIDLDQYRNYLVHVDYKTKLIIRSVLVMGRIFCVWLFGIGYLLLMLMHYPIWYVFTWGLFWAIPFTLFGIWVIGIFFIPVIYLGYVSKYFINRFKLINLQSVGLTYTQNKLRLWAGVEQLFEEIDKTHRALKTVDNQFWQMFFLSNWILISVGLADEAIVVIYADIHPILRFTFICDMSTFIMLIFLILHFAVKVHLEANKTYYFLNFLYNGTHHNLLPSHKIKV